LIELVGLYWELERLQTQGVQDQAIG
jgi:hypothetical protein